MHIRLLIIYVMDVDATCVNKLSLNYIADIPWLWNMKHGTNLTAMQTLLHYSCMNYLVHFVAAWQTHVIQTLVEIVLEARAAANRSANSCSKMNRLHLANVHGHWSHEMKTYAAGDARKRPNTMMMKTNQNILGCRDAFICWPMYLHRIQSSGANVFSKQENKSITRSLQIAWRSTHNGKTNDGAWDRCPSPTLLQATWQSHIVRVLVGVRATCHCKSLKLVVEIETQCEIICAHAGLKPNFMSTTSRLAT